METFLESLLTVASWLLRTSLQASVVIALVLLAQWALRDRLAPRWRYALWLLVAVRLAMPILPQSSWSVFNLAELADGGGPLTPSETVVAMTPWPTDMLEVPVDPMPSPGPVLSHELLASSPPAPLATPVRRAAISPMTLSHWLAVTWLAVAVFLALRVLIANVRLARRVGRSEPVDDPDILALLAKCKRQLAIRSMPRVVVTDAVKSPALMGVLRPTILLPQDAPRAPGAPLSPGLSPSELRFVFLHELAHLKHKDNLTNWLLTAAGVLHWFNPMIWWALWRCRADRELAADATVLAATGADQRHDYGRVLLKIVQRLQQTVSYPSAPGAVGIFERPSQLRRRVTLITRARRHSRWWMLATMGAMLAIGLTTLTEPAPAQTEEVAHNDTQPTETSDEIEENAIRTKAQYLQASEQTRQRLLYPFFQRVDQLQREGKYERAIERLHQVLFFDPGNVRATKLKQSIEDTMLFEIMRAVAREVDRDRMRGISTHLSHMETERMRWDHDKRVMGKLKQEIPINFQDVRLDDALDHLNRNTSVDISTNWPVLKKAGVEREFHVTLPRKRIAAERALSLILDLVSAKTTEPVTWTIHEGMVKISTADDLKRTTIVTSLYDVRDLLVTPKDENNQPDRARDDHSPTRQDLLDQLIDRIHKTVGKEEDWLDASISIIEEINGILVIKSTSANHHGIIALLGHLHQAAQTQPQAKLDVAPRKGAADDVDPKRYIIKPTDTIRVIAPGAPELNNVSVRLKPDGFIKLFLLGDIKAIGKTPIELAAEIQQQTHKYYKNVSVKIHVIRPKAKAMEPRRIKAELQRAQTTEIARRREVQRIFQRVYVLQKEQKLERAIELLHQALFLDPGNVAAQALKVSFEDTMLYIRVRDAKRRISRGAIKDRVAKRRISPASKGRAETTEPMVPSAELMIDERDRQAALKLKKQIPIEFHNTRLSAALDFLHEITGADFFPNWPMLMKAGVKPDFPISLQLASVPAEQALDLIVGLVSTGTIEPVAWTVHEGLVKISTADDIKRTTITTHVYDVRDLLVIPDDRKQKTFPTRKELVDQLIGSIEKTVGDKDEWMDASMSGIAEFSGKLVVKTTAANHQGVADLLHQLRQPAQTKPSPSSGRPPSKAR